MSENRLSRRQLLGAGASAAVAAALGCASRTATGTAGPGATGQVPTRRRGRDERRARLRQRQDPHDRPQQHCRDDGVDEERTLRRGRHRRARARARRTDRRSEGAHGGARHHRQPQPHRVDGESSRLPHAARERLLDSRRPGNSRRPCRRHSARRVDYDDRRFSPEPAVSGGGGRPRLPTLAELDEAVAEQSRVHLGVVQRSLGHEHSGPEVLRKPDSSHTSRRATDRSPLGRRARAARRWRCGRHS